MRIDSVFAACTAVQLGVSAVAITETSSHTSSLVPASQHQQHDFENLPYGDLWKRKDGGGGGGEKGGGRSGIAILRITMRQQLDFEIQLPV